ncbi:MFS transporter [Kitasatospora purpeofusca]|uniref:MFS transporter n=1 Tax=Kitasatospora purpeofusca TaxID=67352 RepID=UPI002A59EF93|nr:MFS transporter [Kitasatospora purpeofusca]MDY0810659.1 MFS transporter [Kitasatospora purpeofusca]
MRIQMLVGFGVFGVFWGAWGALIPEIQAQAGVSNGELGVAVLMIGLGALGSMRPAGAAVQRFGRSAVAAILLTMAAAVVLPGLAHGARALMAALAVLGAASGAVDVGINTLAIELESRSGRLMNAAHACFSACVVLGALTSGLALERGLAVDRVLLVTAVLMAGAAGVIGFPGPAGPPTVYRRDRRRPPVTDRPLLALGALCALAYLIENAWQSWSAVMLRSVFHTGSGAAAAGPVVFAAAAAVGRLAGHGLTARLPQRHLLALGGAVAAVGTLGAALAPGVRSMLAALVVAGLGTSVCVPTILSLAGEQARPEVRSSAVAVVASMGYGGCLLGPAAVGLAASSAGLRAALCGVAGMAAVLALASLLARPGPGPGPQAGQHRPARPLDAEG